jgi:Ca2+-binding RTX toxin-like protein
VLTLIGSASVANYQTALRTVTYTDTSETPNIANRTVSFVVNDGASNSAAGTKTVSVTAVNDIPVLANAIPDLPATQINNLFSFTFNANTFTDADSTLLYSATLADNSALPAWLLFNGNTRTFSGTPQAGDTGSLSVKVTATDGATPISDTFIITVVTNQGLIVGTALADSLTGSAGNDTFVGAAGNDNLNGAGGIDTAQFSGLSNAYTITRNGITTTVSGPDGTDTLTSIERLQFAGGGARTLEHADRDFGDNGKSDIL